MPSDKPQVKPGPEIVPEQGEKALILRGIAGHYDGKDWPRGAMYEQPAIDYLKLRGYEPIVLDVPGWTGANSEQTKQALAKFRADPSIKAIYGFSGGADNAGHVIRALTDEEKDRLELLVAVGADYGPDYFAGPWELVFQGNPPQGHMYGPHAVLAKYKTDTGLA